MQPSDRSKGPPKMTIGPLPTPPGGARTPQAPPKGAPAVGTGILSGSGLNFGPAYVPPKRQPATQGQPVLVTVPSPRAPRQPAPHEPLPMKGVVEAYAKGAKGPDVWPAARPARPATPTTATPARPAAAPVATPPPAAVESPRPAPEPVADPGPAPAWMAAQPAPAKRPNRMPLFIGGAAILAVGAIAGAVLLNRHEPDTAVQPYTTAVEQTAPAATEPLRPLQEVATAEAPPPAVTPEPVAKPVVKPPRTQVAEKTPTPAPVVREPAPQPIQVTPQPLAIAPPPAPVQQPVPRIIIPHVDPSAPIETRSSADQ